MMMSGFRITPREGYLACLRRICGCLVQYSNECMQVMMEKLDYYRLPDYDPDWLQLVCRNVRETLLEKCPTPRGKSICTMKYKDTNLYHKMCTGRAITGVLHFINKTPID
jgi:hypothetical protein